MKLGRRREDWLFPLLAATCLALAWAFVRLGSGVTEGQLAGVDRAVRVFVQERQSPGWLAFFGAITMLGSKPVLIGIAAVVGWLLFRSVAWVLLIVACAAVSAEFVDFLKGEFAVLRPPTGLATRKSASFPSGHAAGAAAIMTLLSYAAVRQRVAVPVIVPAAVLIVALVAASRVYLDVHWASDVLGGLLIGMMLGVACCAMFEWMRRRRLAARQEGDQPVTAR